MNPSSTDPQDAPAAWPYASLLLVGFFGTNSPEGRRLAWATTFSLCLLTVALFGTSLFPGGWKFISAMGIPASAVLVALAYVRYLRNLDELARQIQLKAMAFAYGVVMILAFSWGAFGLVREAFAPHPWLLVTWLLIAEPLRGLALVHLARQYR